MKVITHETHYMKNMVLLWSTIYETHSMKDKVLLWSTSVEKEIVALPLFSFSLIFWAFSFYGLSLFSPHFRQCSRKWWSSHFYLFTTQWLQLNTRTKYDSIWMPPVVYRDSNDAWVTCTKELWTVALPQLNCQLINGMVESCMAIYLGMAMEMP